MSDEARNVDLLKQAYARWHDSKGGSADEWLKLCADNIAFGSLGRCTFRYKKTGKVVSTPKCDSWRFANGKAVEFYEYYDIAQVHAAAVAAA